MKLLVKNVPNVTKVLYTHGERNIQLKNPLKFGINVTGFQGINCNPYMEVNTKNNAFQFIITLCHYPIENMKNTFGKQLIKEAMTNENLSDEKIKKISILKIAK